MIGAENWLILFFKKEKLIRYIYARYVFKRIYTVILFLLLILCPIQMFAWEGCSMKTWTMTSNVTPIAEVNRYDDNKNDAKQCAPSPFSPSVLAPQSPCCQKSQSQHWHDARIHAARQADGNKSPPALHSQHRHRLMGTCLLCNQCSLGSANMALSHIAENKFLTILPPSCDTQMMYSDNVVKNLKNSIF